MLPITTLFLLILSSGSLSNIREVYSLGSIVSTVSVIIDPSSSIGPVLVASLVSFSSSAIFLQVAVKRKQKISCYNTSTRVVAKFLSKLIKLNINVNSYVNKLVKGVSTSASAHKLFLNLKLKALTEHCYKSSIVLVSVSSKLLKVRCVICS